jgi:hypothetical protein
MIELIAIDNPRTPDGKWQDMSGCSFCGAVSCGYVGIRVMIDEEEHTIQICGSCLLDAQKEMHKSILEQCQKGRI